MVGHGHAGLEGAVHGRLAQLLPSGRVLELGCGTGVPVSQMLATLHAGGLLVGNMGASDQPDAIEEDWLGTRMFFSSFDGEVNRALIRDTGFDLLEAEGLSQTEPGDQRVEFLWFVAKKAKKSGHEKAMLQATGGHHPSPAMTGVTEGGHPRQRDQRLTGTNAYA